MPTLTESEARTTIAPIDVGPSRPRTSGTSQPVAKVDLKYLETFRHHGKLLAYYRRDGFRKRLRDEDGRPVDPEDIAALTAAWQRAHTAHEAADRAAEAKNEERKVRPHSIADLIARYRSPDNPAWTEKKPATRVDYEKGLVPLERDYGNLPVAGLLRRHVTAIRDRYAFREIPHPEIKGAILRVANARQANRVVTVLSILLSFAIDPLGWREDNPALRPKRLKRKTSGYLAWTPDQFRQFWQVATPDWRLAAAMAALTGQRGQDQVAMTWADYDGQRVHVVQQKGNGTVKLWVPCHPDLKLLLDRRKRANARLSPAPVTILARPDGRPWEVNAFQKAAGAAIRSAGLEGVVWHGLRSSAMSWAAEGGASENQLMALSGHRTPNMARYYTRSANQQRLATGAVEAIDMPVKNIRRTKTANHRRQKLPTSGESGT
ncbi:MAG TPA: tyrosine-type recombinase/integrase [Acetobacteraceae bacterium]|nr:tyrosine-type recombinase/integrase [Acetobacteraceae bacterium]